MRRDELPSKAAIPEGTDARGTQLERVPISLTLTSGSISRSLSKFS